MLVGFIGGGAPSVFAGSSVTVVEAGRDCTGLIGGGLVVSKAATLTIEGLPRSSSPFLGRPRFFLALSFSSSEKRYTVRLKLQ